LCTASAKDERANHMRERRPVRDDVVSIGVAQERRKHSPRGKWRRLLFHRDKAVGLPETR